MPNNSTATWTADPRLTPWRTTAAASEAPTQPSSPVESMTPVTDTVADTRTTTGTGQQDWDLEDAAPHEDGPDDDLDADIDDEPIGPAQAPPVLPAPRPTPRPRQVTSVPSDTEVPLDPGTHLTAAVTAPAEAAPALGAVSTARAATPNRPRPGEMATGPGAPELGDLVRLRSARPTRGWRGAAYTVSRGAWNPGLSPAEAERRRLIRQARTQLPGWHTVTVASVKGGIGKTTVTAGLGLTLAEHRGDRIVALDANPDAGTLADRLTGHCGITVRELIHNLATIKSWTDIAHYTSLAGRLQVLASEQDPEMSEAFSREEYEAVRAILIRFYNVIITDSGTGLVHSAMGGALDGTKSLVIAGAPTVDGASRAAKTLDWLLAHGYRELVERAVVALSCDRSSRDVDRAAIVSYFQARCATVVEVPADPHLAVGGLISLDELHQRTRDAFLRLGAAVAEQFSWDAPHLNRRDAR